MGSSDSPKLFRLSLFFYLIFGHLPYSLHIIATSKTFSLYIPNIFVLFFSCSCKYSCGMDRLEALLFKLEVLDHKARERAGVITPTLGSPIPVLLRFDAATEVTVL